VERDWFVPFHVTTLGSTESENPVLRKDIQTHGVDTLLIDDDKVLELFLGIDSLVANEVLQSNDFGKFGIDEFSLRLDKFLPLLC